MEAAPREILLLIFQAYTEGFSQPPTLLLRVCRRWKNIIIDSPILWSLVRISVDSINTVPNILNEKDGSLLAYLSRSERPNASIPLDIEIRWLPSKDKAADHLSACTISTTDAADCLNSQCELLKKRHKQLRDLLQELAGPKRQLSNKIMNDSNRTTRWRSLLLDLGGLFNFPSERAEVSLWPLGSEGFRLLPNLEYLSIRNGFIPNFNFDPPKLRHLEFDNAQSPWYRWVDNVERVTICGDKSVNILNWGRCHRLKVLEVFSMDMWYFPGDVPFPSLKTIAVDTSAPPFTWSRIGEAFNDSRPLDTLIFLGILPGGFRHMLDNGGRIRCHNLLLGSQYLIRNRNVQRRHFDTTLEGWVERRPAGHRNDNLITPVSIEDARELLSEMKTRGTRVTAIDSHMKTWIQMARQGRPDLDNE